ncbi:peptidoglycan/LPS O-acetylase OafA/YrhL [Micromonospora luteifusca]|uniref:Peptidoglycan/LPS O-acetylase OafA/YrhL n=1 Tax=Micromonospora luteifusca TaxID=709860 RepID=A0ABS2LYI1_9ACTN|nr:acyltransferase [Micromonospora luteifusca]MBM7493242.1 peptidoglycan/LPS O-acetylase OafA/YrhL [Micromonospora luteifusca]
MLDAISPTSSVAPAAPPPAKRPRLAVLDGLRLVAAVSVVFCHYTASNDAWDQNAKQLFPFLHQFSQYGWLGVEVFFLISGFVICMSAWNKSLGDFVVSRVARLYPAYWIAIVLAVTVISIWPSVRYVRSWTDVAVNLTMLQEGLGVRNVDGVYWTLFIELKFYLLFAIVVGFGVTYRRCVLFCGLWTVASLAATVAGGDLLVMWAEPLYSPYFIAGIALYLIYRFGPTAVPFGILGLSFILAELTVTRRVARLTFDTTNEHHPIATWPAQAVVAVAFCFMTLLALGAFNRIQWRWLTTAGALTYPLYLLHQDIGLTVLHALRDDVPPYVLVFGTLLAMLLLAWLVHRLGERPLARLVERVMRNGMADLRRHSADPPPRRDRVSVPPVALPQPEPVGAGSSLRP